VYAYHKKKMIKIFCQKKGALLLEVLIAVVILSVCLTLIAKSLLTCLRATVTSADYTEAVILLDNKFSEIIQKKSIAANIREEGVFEAPFERFSYVIESAPVSFDGLDGLNEVTADVSWGMGLKERKITLRVLLLNQEEAGEL